MNTTIHNDIESWLAADVHDQLPPEERDALHQHLVECPLCRQLHQEEKIMHKLLEETLTPAKADPTFEQRMLAGFRRRIPDQRSGVARFLLNAVRSRVTQVAAAAVVLLALVQTGRIITHEESHSRAVADEQMPAQFADRRIDEIEKKDLGFNSLGKLAGRAKAAPATSSGPAELRQERPASPPDATITSNEAAPNSSLNVQRDLTDQVESRKSKDAEKAAGETDGDQRKLVRSAQVELEIISFDGAVEKITALARESGGYVATSSSQKQANGKLRGEIVVKVRPDQLDRFLQKIRGLGELKNQTLGTEDITKAYFDTDARLKTARVMEQRLLEMLKTKTGKVSDLLEVERELGRVREAIEKMQGELKYWDTQVQLAAVTISLSEKDLEEPAAFLLRERAQLALYAPEVEAVYDKIKALASPQVQITNAQLDRDNSGQVSARLSMLIAPEASDAVMAQVKGFGRVESFQVESERVAQGGEGMSQNAKTKRDKVQLNITLSREEQEQALQQTSLQIRTSAVDDKTVQLRRLVEQQQGRVRASSFSRDPNGGELANLSLRVPMKNYGALMRTLNSLGKVENVTVQRQDRPREQTDAAHAPADISIQIYSPGNIVSADTGIMATLRRTLAQGAGALMWSLRMIGVALAFFAPWLLALGGLIWIGRRVVRARKARRQP